MKTDFKKQVSEFLSGGVPKQTAKDLKESFGIPYGKVNKGILLICALFDLAVNKGSVPAAKELISLGMNAGNSEEDTILSLISDLKEDD
ncbi:MAG: hypothetical protein IJN39_00725 [Clostridia bacterium]|nr:hypothetical protein [Clostridia bacterium]